MYDMSRVTAFGYNDINDEDARYEARKAYNNVRTEDYKNKKYTLVGGNPNPEELPEDLPKTGSTQYGFIISVLAVLGCSYIVLKNSKKQE